MLNRMVTMAMHNALLNIEMSLQKYSYLSSNSSETFKLGTN